MRAEGFVGQVIRALSRQTSAFRPSPARKDDPPLRVVGFGLLPIRGERRVWRRAAQEARRLLQMARTDGDDVVAHAERDCVLLSSGLPLASEKDKRAEFAAVLVRAHQKVYGTWPEPERVGAALDALGHPAVGHEEEAR